MTETIAIDPRLSSGLEASGGADENQTVFLVFEFQGRALKNLHTARSLVGIEVEGAINDLLEHMRQEGLI